MYSPISSTRTIDYRFVGPLAPFWILKINSMKDQKITDFGFTQMRFLGDGLIDARKDELNKKIFFTIRLLGLKICDLISYLSSTYYDPPL